MKGTSAAVRAFAHRDVVTVDRATPVSDCARIMRERHVGSVIVLDDKGRRDRPVGIVTDRDIVVEVVATRLNAETLSAGEIMTAPLATIGRDEDVMDALGRMREKGARRLPVVDDDGALVGIVSLDDLLSAVADQIDAMVHVVKSEQAHESAARR